VKAEVEDLLAWPDSFTPEERARAYIVLQRGFSRWIKDLMLQLRDESWAAAAAMHGDELDERFLDEQVVAWLAEEQAQAQQPEQPEQQRQEEPSITRLLIFASAVVTMTVASVAAIAANARSDRRS
jgi:hypothetical protein